MNSIDIENFLNRKGVKPTSNRILVANSRSFKYELCHSDAHHTISDQHVHFYCERCKQTYCFESDRIPLVNIPEGFYPHAINYMIKGICPNCIK